MVVELVVIIICLILSILIANHRLRAFNRLLLVAGIIYTIYGLILLLVPQLIMPMIKDAQGQGVFEAVKYIISPLAYFSLIAGIIAIVVHIVIALVLKKSKPQSPAVETHPPTNDTKQVAPKHKAASSKPQTDKK